MRAVRGEGGAGTAAAGQPQQQSRPDVPAAGKHAETKVTGPGEPLEGGGPLGRGVTAVNSVFQRLLPGVRLEISFFGLEKLFGKVRRRLGDERSEFMRQVPWPALGSRWLPFPVHTFSSHSTPTRLRLAQASTKAPVARAAFSWPG